MRSARKKLSGSRDTPLPPSPWSSESPELRLARASGALLARIDGHDNAVLSVALAPDGTLATASRDRSVALCGLAGPLEPRVFTPGGASEDLQTVLTRYSLTLAPDLILAPVR